MAHLLEEGYSYTHSNYDKLFIERRIKKKIIEIELKRLEKFDFSVPLSESHETHWIYENARPSVTIL